MEDAPRKTFEDLIDEFDSAMLVSRTSTGVLRSRPMQVVGDEGGGHLWFVTGRRAPKMEEIEADPHVNITMQGGGRYLSISGTMRRHDDRQRIRAMWSDTWLRWFPNGRDDPDIALLELLPSEAEYWSMDGGETGGLRYLFAAGRATTSGQAMPGDVRGHAKLDL